MFRRLVEILGSLCHRLEDGRARGRRPQQPGRRPPPTAGGAGGKLPATLAFGWDYVAMVRRLAILEEHVDTLLAEREGAEADDRRPPRPADSKGPRIRHQNASSRSLSASIFLPLEICMDQGEAVRGGAVRWPPPTPRPSARSRPRRLLPVAAGPRMRVLSVLSSSNQMYSGMGRAVFELTARLTERVDFEIAIDDRDPRNLDLVLAFGRDHGIPVHVGPALDCASVARHLQRRPARPCSPRRLGPRRGRSAGRTRRPTPPSSATSATGPWPIPRTTNRPGRR